MRAFMAQIEQMPVSRFVVVVALIGGILSGAPQILVGISSSDHSAQIGLAGIRIAGLLALGFIAAQRRQSSIWQSAWHVTLGLALGDLVGFAVAFNAASIQSDGEYASAYFQAPLLVTLPGLIVPTLLNTPARMLSAAGVVALVREFRKNRRAPSEADTGALP
jgi:hypothetical protein